MWQPRPLPAAPCSCSQVMETPSVNVVAAAGITNVRGCMGKAGRVNGMSSVTLFRTSLFIEQHTVLSDAVLKNTWSKL